jgi:hypothetical protein
MAERDADNADEYEATYGDGAECWSGEAAAALACTEQCQAGLEEASIDDPGEPACWSSDLPDARNLFTAYPVWAYICTTDLCYNLTASFAATTSGQAFSMSLLWTSDFSIATQCVIARDLSFECNPTSSSEHDYDFSGAFSTAFSESTLDETRDGEHNCSYEGVPSAR